MADSVIRIEKWIAADTDREAVDARWGDSFVIEPAPFFIEVRKHQ